MNIQELTNDLISFKENYKDLLKNQQQHLLGVTNHKIKNVAAVLSRKSDDVAAVRSELEAVRICLSNIYENLEAAGEKATENIEAAAQKMLSQLTIIQEKLKKLAASKPQVQNYNPPIQRQSPVRGNSPTMEHVENEEQFYATQFSVPLEGLRKSGITDQTTAEVLEVELNDLRNVIPLNSPTRDFVNQLLANWYLNQQNVRALRFIEQLRNQDDRLSRMEQAKKMILNHIGELKKKPKPDFLSMMKLLDLLRVPVNVPLKQRVLLLNELIPETEIQNVYQLCVANGLLMCAYTLLVIQKKKNSSLNIDEGLELISKKLSEIDQESAKQVASKIKDPTKRAAVLKALEDSDDSGNEADGENDGRLRQEGVTHKPNQNVQRITHVGRTVVPYREPSSDVKDRASQPAAAPQNVYNRSLVDRVQQPHHECSDEGMTLAIVQSMGDKQSITQVDTAVLLENSVDGCPDATIQARARILLVGWYIATEAYVKAEEHINKLDLSEAKPMRQRLKESIQARIKMCSEKNDLLGAVDYASCLELEDAISNIKLIPLDKKQELFKNFLKQKDFGKATLCALACTELTPAKRDDLLRLVMLDALDHDFNYAQLLPQYFSDLKLKSEMQKAIESAKERDQKAKSANRTLHVAFSQSGASKSSSLFDFGLQPAKNLKVHVPDAGEETALRLIQEAIKVQGFQAANAWYSLVCSVRSLMDESQRKLILAEMTLFQSALLSRAEKLLAEISPSKTPTNRDPKEEKATEQLVLAMYNALLIVKEGDAKNLKKLISRLPTKDLNRDQGTCALINWYISQKDFTKSVVILLQSIIDEKLRRQMTEQFDKAKAGHLDQIVRDPKLKKLENIDKPEIRQNHLKAILGIYDSILETIQIVSPLDRSMLLEETILELHRFGVSLELL